jgi:hypothetical protein
MLEERRLPVLMALILALICFGSAASAGWKISSETDRLTGQSSGVATALSLQKDNGAEAGIHLYCLNDSRSLSIFVSIPMSRGQVRVRYRVDDGPPILRVGRVLWDPYQIPLFGEIITPRSKRFRFELQLERADPLFYDVDVSGADKAFAAVKCRGRSQTSVSANSRHPRERRHVDPHSRNAMSGEEE